jgi:hypothetical protein
MHEYGFGSGMDPGTGRYGGKINECLNDDGIIRKMN